MGALVATAVKATEFSGEIRTKVFTVTPAALSDTIDLSDYFDTLYYANAHLTAGLDALLTHLQVSWSGTTVTIKQLAADGSTDASDWTSAAIEVLVVGSDTQNAGS